MVELVVPREPIIKNRLIGDPPKILIRPLTDARCGGVRESLEGQILAQARATAAFLTANLRHSSGLPVECIVPDFCIGGRAEAARVTDLAQRDGAKIKISVTSCWCYPTEVMDDDPYAPQAIWGFNGTERPGAVLLAALEATYNQYGIPLFSIYGRDVQDAGDVNIPSDVKRKLLQFARAALTTTTIRGKSYLGIGGPSMGIAGSIIDQPFFRNYLGMHVETVDMTEITRRINERIYDHGEYELALAWVKKNCCEGQDYNPEEKQRTRSNKDEDWEMVVKMVMIVRDLMIGNPKLAEMGFPEEAQGHNAIAAGFQGQRQWTDIFPNGDFMEAFLNTSVDWNGIREAFIVATENDGLNGVCMLVGHIITCLAQIFADVRTFWSPEAIARVTKTALGNAYQLTGLAEAGIIHLINSGAATLDATGKHIDAFGRPTMKPFWNLTPEEAEACLRATTWFPAILEYFRSSGYSSGYLTDAGEQMPVTMTRLNTFQGLGPALQIAEGWFTNLPPEIHAILDERTNRTWPSHWFVPKLTGSYPFDDPYNVMDQWKANHGAVSFGHIGADLITWAAMQRIPVCMHNVPQDQIFRPSYWAGAGVQDPMGADFRACAGLGPIYR